MAVVVKRAASKAGVRDRLHSIAHDAAFVAEARAVYGLPLAGNLRAGPWHAAHADALAYFKSTDGHHGAWQLSRTRLNAHVIELAAARGGVLLVDTTRRGRSLPDSFAKTVPIWAACWNAAIQQYRRAHNMNVVEEEGWDTTLHTPGSVSASEHHQIEQLLPGMVASLLECSAVDWARMARIVAKPLRPLWVTTNTRFFAGELPDPARFPFLPIVCVSASLPIDVAAFPGFVYLQGAADDEEAWARGLSYAQFWRHSAALLAAPSEQECIRLIDKIVEADDEDEQGEEREREMDANRAGCALRSAIEGPSGFNGGDSQPEQQGETNSGRLGENHASPASANDSLSCLLPSSRGWSPLGATGIAVGGRRAGRPPACWTHFDAIINCCEHEYTGGAGSASLPTKTGGAYYHMNIPEGKRARREMEDRLPAALSFAHTHLCQGRRLLVHCSQGMDRSVTVAAAILTAYFDPHTHALLPEYAEGSGGSRTDVTKGDIMRWLQWISMCHPLARPSRSNVKRLHRFFLPAPPASADSLDDT